jgi:Fic family protein
MQFHTGVLPPVDVDLLGQSPVGRLTPTTVSQHGRDTHHHAFVPDPLPVSVELSAATYAAIERAAGELGMLEGCARQLDDPYIITAPFIRREAQSTSALEGTISELEDVFGADLVTEDDEAARHDAAITEVVNYVVAAEQGVRAIAGRPVNARLLHELHLILMTGTSEAGASGRVRTQQVAIGSHRGQLVTDARFVPPPADMVEDLLDSWEAWNYDEAPMPLIARVALSHYQFETIHPYKDGNGRIGRLAAILLLIDRGPLSDHYLALSPYIEARRTRYIDLLAQTSATGDFDPWVRFFAEAIEAEAKNARSRITALLDFSVRAGEIVREAGLSGVATQVAEGLVSHPVLSVKTIEKAYEVTFQTANRAIGKLVELGLLEEVTGGSYARRFRAPRFFEILVAGADESS